MHRKTKRKTNTMAAHGNYSYLDTVHMTPAIYKPLGSKLSMDAAAPAAPSVAAPGPAPPTTAPPPVATPPVAHFADEIMRAVAAGATGSARVPAHTNGIDAEPRYPSQNGNGREHRQSSHHRHRRRHHRDSDTDTESLSGESGHYTPSDASDSEASSRAGSVAGRSKPSSHQRRKSRYLEEQKRHDMQVTIELTNLINNSNVKLPKDFDIEKATTREKEIQLICARYKEVR